MAGSHAPARVSARLRAAALLTHLALIGWLLALLRPLPLLGALLLLPALPGLWRNRVYTAQWACMLVAFYSALWLAEGWANPAQRLQAFGIAALAAVDFVSLVLYVRLRQREATAPAAGSADASR